ncbi:MAG TPA: cbb3-type cytochrome c oxidase N-terminal domain-containing protein, partial [Flavobacteriales bacterium]|nr:cbb3-type cytochrome c oxidase N-terminal domain-containing protein [Flavobacteriales bacterium]HPQ57725.1 cbb3-type cytochrome c oxidase N-terminal domain-containing protein [Flavobacteriales bacterium]
MTRIETKRPIMILAGLAAPLAMAAQDAAPAVAGSGPAMETNYLLLGVAVLQVIIILALSSIMRNLGGNGSAWARRMAVKRAAAGAVVLAFLAWPAEASAAVPGTMFLVTTATLFWMLISANLILFVVLLAQLNVLRGMVRTLSGREEEELALAKEAEEPSFADTILHKLTQAVDVEHEEDVLMHHEYDGIRELNNVLPPWWLWLFYGTIIWGVVYLVNVHILGVMPLQAEEYEQEMAQAKEDVAAYLAQFSNLVDESNVTVATDEATLASGESIYKQFCVACHGANGEGGVGPNMTDAYWIHGGGIKNVFKTIKYGVPQKGMISWQSQLKPSEMQAVASYILTLQGTDPPNQKEPQGEIWKEEAAPAEEAPVEEEAPVTADSTAVAV